MKQKYIKPAIIVLVLLICGIGIWKFCSDSDAGMENTQGAESSGTEAVFSVPWEADGAKKPEEYTLEEYQELSSAQQKAFLEYLGEEGYNRWLEKIEIDAANLPWKKDGAKQPMEYTWEEFQALTETEQKAFMANLGPYGLEEWLQKVQHDRAEIINSSSETSGTKQLMEYTWAEYQALSDAEKKAFVDQLGAKGFQQWLTKVQGDKYGQSLKEELPWEKTGAKKPADYTLEEYEALTPAQQQAFQKYLGTDAFNAWLEKVQDQKCPWEEYGAKQPEDYTWEEYDVLSEYQKKAFQEYLGARGFEIWLEQFFLLEEYPWEKDGAKRPEDYTWTEYKALTEDQQYAFQHFLGSAGMETWLSRITNIPWETSGAKQPENYTLQEYEKLTEQQKLAFRIHLGAAGFDAWKEEAQRVQEEYPWEVQGAKQPKDYTLAEYNALTESQQIAFQNHLGATGFEEWLRSKTEAYPWEVQGAKQPKDYTLAEYNALTASQQMGFQNHLGAEGFAVWLNKVQSQTDVMPWEKSGAKQPAEYTLAEYEALTAAQQMAFQKYLGAEGFDTWLKKNQTQSEEVNPWEKPGAKQPEDYTMEEFNSLTAAQQMAFQNYLGSDGFAAWLKKNQTQSEEVNPWDVPGAKQPEDYTMGEFNALTAAQQMAFQNYLGSDGFAEWLSRNQSQSQTVVNPWEKSGAKQPEEYTMEEFEALTAAQQIAFQNYLGPEGFAEWLSLQEET